MVKVREKFGPSGEDASQGDSVDRAPPPAAGSRYYEDDEPTQQQAEPGAPDWVGIARSCFDDSTTYFDASIRAQLEAAERAFQNRHPAGSKYFSDVYKARSKIFRPKTRSAIRAGEAMVAASFFASEDVVMIQAINQNDPRQAASAKINKALIQYRLTCSQTNIGIPWFLTLVGAAQDAQKSGVVASYQSWIYETRQRKEIRPVLDPAGEPILDENNNPTFEEQEVEEVVKDKPDIRLIPVENIRIDRAADWRDPVQTSPFLIICWPMYIHEVEARMEEGNRKTGAKPWLRVSREELKGSRRDNRYDSTRQQREGERQDSKESEIALDDFQIVWVHENFVRWKGEEWTYYTAGTSILLSDPVPVSEVHHIGERPVAMGFWIVETHRTYPSGKPKLTEGLQAAANDLANARLDNVKLALNKRHLVKRGANVDLLSLIRNSPGSSTLVNDTEKDVKVVDTKDVTASSYQEQDRINVDFDEIVGQMSTGTVQTNRKLNETVGGMEIIKSAGNLLSELDLRVFTTSWAEKALWQLLRLEQIYENDETILAIAADKAQLFQRYGIDTVTDDLLEQGLTLTVNAGIGATSAEERLKKFATGAEVIEQVLGDIVKPHMNAEEVVGEVFGLIGYRDGKRFYNFGDQDPVVEMLMKHIQELQMKLDRRVEDAQAKVTVANIGARAKQLTAQIENTGALSLERLRQQGAISVEDLRTNKEVQLAVLDLLAEAHGRRTESEN